MKTPVRSSLATMMALGVAALGGCGGSAITQPPAPGVLKVAWSPSTTSTLGPIAGRILFEEVFVLGDTAIDQRAMMRDIPVPFESPSELPFTDLPQGIYSRYRSEVRGVTLDGQYGGTPLHIDVLLDHLFIDLRGDGVEISLGHSGRFLVGFDPASWFAAGELDAAEQTEGEILLDPTHNVDLLLRVLNRMPDNFSFATQATVATTP